MFNLVNNKVQPEPEVLLIPEFKYIWESYDVEEAMSILAYIYFIEDYSSPYKKSYNGKDLIEKVSTDLFPKGFKETKEIIEARIKYKELKTTFSMKLMEGVEKQVKEITDFLNNTSLADVPDNKKYSAIADMMTVLKSIDDLTIKVQSTKKRIEQEITAAKMAGKRTLGKRELPPSKRK